MTISWAVHRLNGVSTPANAAYSVDELHHQLVTSGAKALFTVEPLLDIALMAAKRAKLPEDKIFVCDLPYDRSSSSRPTRYRTFKDLVSEGQNLPAIENIRWSEGQGTQQTAFLCYSSGTSGLPVCVAILISYLRLIECIESRHDIAPERHCKRITDVDFRSYESRSLRTRFSRCGTGLAPSISHIQSCICMSCFDISWR